MADAKGLEGSQPVNLSKHPSGSVPTVLNIVSTVKLDCKIDLKALSLQARNAEYNPQVCTGAKSEQDSKLAARKYARIVQKLGFPCKIQGFQDSEGRSFAGFQDSEHRKDVNCHTCDWIEQF